MGTDPEPYDVPLVQDTKGAIVNAHSRRVYRTPPTHSLEVRARVIGVRREEQVRLARLPLHVGGKALIGVPEALLSSERTATALRD